MENEQGKNDKEFADNFRLLVANNLLKIIGAIFGVGIIVGFSMNYAITESKVSRLEKDIDLLRSEIQTVLTYQTLTEKGLTKIYTQADVENNQQTAKAIQELLITLENKKTGR